MTIYKNLNTKRSNYLKEYLTNNYSTKTKKTLIDDLGLSWSYIQRMARLFGLNREIYESKNRNTLSKLLDLNDNITCYWLGFLLADGHISRKSLQINLSIKDQYFFENIKSHLNIELSPRYTGKNNSVVRYCISDNETIHKLQLLFNWNTNKTKNPPNIPKLSYEQLFSLVIGFIDGDGHIDIKGNLLIVKCDLSWKKILEHFYKVLMNEDKKFNVTGDNCAIFFISSPKELQRLKNICLSLNLPIMNRKWDRIKTDRIFKQDKYLIVENMLNNNESISDVMKKTNFSHSLVYKTKKHLEDSKKEMVVN